MAAFAIRQPGWGLSENPRSPPSHRRRVFGALDHARTRPPPKQWASARPDAARTAPSILFTGYSRVGSSCSRTTSEPTLQPASPASPSPRGGSARPPKGWRNHVRQHGRDQRSGSPRGNSDGATLPRDRACRPIPLTRRQGVCRTVHPGVGQEWVRLSRDPPRGGGLRVGGRVCRRGDPRRDRGATSGGSTGSPLERGLKPQPYASVVRHRD